MSHESPITLASFHILYTKLQSKKSLAGNDAIKAVEENGDALRYVKDQTEAICLKAVEKNGDALRYVAEYMFATRVTTSAEIS